MSLRRTALAAVPLCVALAAGCSASSTPSASGADPAMSTSSSASLPTVKDLFEQARSSALAAKSMRIVGSITQGGSEVSLELSGAVDGSNQQMVAEVPSLGKVTMLVVAGKSYLRLSPELVKSLGQEAALKPYVGKWIVVPQAQAKSMGSTTTKSILDDMFADTEMTALDQVTTQVAKESVDGIPAYVLSDATGKSQAKVYVTADGKARLLKIVSTGSNAGTMTVSDWDAVAAYPAPSGKDLAVIPGM